MDISPREIILSTRCKREPLEGKARQEWGDSVYVREFTGPERLEFDQYFLAGDGHMQEHALRMCLVDAEGKHIFPVAGETEEQRAASLQTILEDLARLPGRITGEVYLQILRVSGLTADVEDAEKEDFSEAPPDAGSGI